MQSTNLPSCQNYKFAITSTFENSRGDQQLRRRLIQPRADYSSRRPDNLLVPEYEMSSLPHGIV